MGDLLFGKYEVKEVLGEGDAAEVYRVHNVRDGKDYAIKVLTAVDDETAERTYREGQIQKQLRHPNICTVHDVILNRRDVGLVMDFVNGPGLDEVLAQGQAFAFEECIDMFREILAGAGAAHQAGVVHRDLKPANILLEESDEGVQARIIDFGLAKSGELNAASRMTAVGQAMGTAGFVAPEQLLDARVAEVTADIFSLGTILYQLICGKPAFWVPKNNMQSFRNSVEGTYIPVTDHVPDCPMHVVAAIDRALSFDPEDRFQSCSEFSLALVGEGLAQKPPPAPLNIKSAHIVTASSLSKDAEVLDFKPAPAPIPVETPQAKPDPMLRLAGLLALLGAVGVLALGVLVGRWLLS